MIEVHWLVLIIHYIVITIVVRSKAGGLLDRAGKAVVRNLITMGRVTMSGVGRKKGMSKVDMELVQVGTGEYRTQLGDFCKMQMELEKKRNKE